MLAGLSSLRDIQDLANESSVRLATKYQAISGAFKKLIVSIQFHDITRQQVEHVVEVLRRLRSKSDGEDGTVVREEHNAAAILALQSLQLGNAGEKFGASVASVARSLDVLKQNIVEILEESRTLSGLSGDRKTSSMLEMERGCSSVLGSLTHYAKGESEMTAIGGVLAETVCQMHVIEIEMHRMAMNASICAAHIGTSGDVLGALAISMQQRAADSRNRSDSLIHALNSMSADATRLSGKEEAVLGNGQDVQRDYMEEMRLAVAELHSSSERSVAQISQILARGTLLGENLASTREAFIVGALFANAVSSAQRRLKDIEEIAPSGLSHEGNETPGPVLAEFATHYTMQAERDVHEGATKALDGAVPADLMEETTEFPPVESDELGDNVEFF
jgi:hypothetical protein